MDLRANLAYRPMQHKKYITANTLHNILNFSEKIKVCYYHPHCCYMQMWPIDLASFPGPAQLSVAFSTVKWERVSTESDGKLDGAWERGYYRPMQHYEI